MSLADAVARPQLMRPHEQVNVFSGAFYDGVYLLGLVLNETLTEGGDIRDGISLTRRMWNRDFHG